MNTKSNQKKNIPLMITIIVVIVFAIAAYKKTHSDVTEKNNDSDHILCTNDQLCWDSYRYYDEYNKNFVTRKEYDLSIKYIQKEKLNPSVFAQRLTFVQNLNDDDRNLIDGLPISVAEKIVKLPKMEKEHLIELGYENKLKTIMNTYQ